MSKAPDNNQEKNSNDEKSALKDKIAELQTMFESCLKKDMSKMETIEYLHRNANWDRTFTRNLWEQLELRNQELFRALKVRRALIEQIRTFNVLLEKQTQLTQSQSVASTSNSVNMAELHDQRQSTEIQNNQDEVRAARINQDQTLLDNAVVNDTSAPGTMNNEKPENPKKLD